MGIFSMLIYNTLKITNTDGIVIKDWKLTTLLELQ